MGKAEDRNGSGNEGGIFLVLLASRILKMLKCHSACSAKSLSPPLPIEGGVVAEAGATTLAISKSTGNRNELESLSKSVPSCHIVRRKAGRKEQTFAGTLKLLKVHDAYRTPFTLQNGVYR